MAPLSLQLFVLFATLVEERAGLHYDVDDRPLFADKLQTRVAATGFDTALDYYYFLRYDPGGSHELDALVDVLVVNETYLFREVDALGAAIEHVVRPAVAERGRARIWSAGCATGEEPLTLAMMLAEANLLDRVELVATDISSRALARARSGKISRRGVRALVPDATTPALSSSTRAANRWLVLAEHGATVHASIVAAIEFRRESLLEPTEPTAAFDLVLCRNVLIYFRDEVVVRVVDALVQRLRPSGRLVVGASESLLRFGTLLRCEERSGAFFYAKDPS